MKCPIDNSDLQMTERQGVEIDYCPKCRGVWLDRGELDKIINREDRPIRDEFESGDSRGKHGRSEGYGKRKREGFLGELFDF